ncbi:MAG TPA: dihydropteroate synthase [Acidimicrobiia bacterium]|nr:dihydropteroate synthase [Acidimicrobiia bacterium]
MFGTARAVVGILNVTPDSFSDGGRYLDLEAAVAHGAALAAAGAHALDVGGESTRPGAEPVSAADEAARVVPVIEALAEMIAVPISVDTTKAEVAAAALDAGATIVNDVSGGRFDADMLPLVAEREAGLVVMHMRGEPRTMQDDPVYDDVVAEVGDFLGERVAAAVDVGVAPTAVMADPGIGFGKTATHNLRLLAALPDLRRRAGVPLLVGTSRKAFIGATLDLPVGERDEGTLATVVWAFDRGVTAVRVHDVETAARAARFLDVVARATQDGIGEAA